MYICVHSALADIDCEAYSGYYNNYTGHSSFLIRMILSKSIYKFMYLCIYVYMYDRFSLTLGEVGRMYGRP